MLNVPIDSVIVQNNELFVLGEPNIFRRNEETQLARRHAMKQCFDKRTRLNHIAPKFDRPRMHVESVLRTKIPG
jgi:hypothetical protein